MEIHRTKYIFEKSPEKKADRNGAFYAPDNDGRSTSLMKHGNNRTKVNRKNIVVQEKKN